jgi:asparagine synthase (glutamine-hydrolysing)
MCGIVGVCHLKGEPVESNLLKRMTDAIAHRGPDGEGHYVEGAVGLGHRRLAVIDLTPAARQPMASEDGKVIVTYNGEIYNFQRLRVELEAIGYWFHSRSDTEVLLHAYEEWGVECVSRFNGMFAFGVYDRRSNEIVLARDRYGVKPLYWYHRNGVFLFASEIKALLQYPRVARAVDYRALNEYFSFQNIFTDRTLFQDIRLLPPGTTLRLPIAEGAEPKLTRYWDFPRPDPGVNASIDACADQLHNLLVHGVVRQLVSDVPVGSYLSGGIDSGSITAIAVRHVPRLTTFTGGFDLSSASGLELGFDERPSAEIMANLYKTEHYEVVLHAGDMEWVLPRLVWHLEDLRVGQSYPNYYIARLASKFVSVVLSGAGGDELFGGYPWRYFHGSDNGSPEEFLRGYHAFWQRLVPDEEKAALFQDEVTRGAADHLPYEIFKNVFGDRVRAGSSTEDFIDASLYFELKTFLHGLLVVEDKLSMAHSLETRVPFLDNDIVDFAARMPARYKLRNLDQRFDLDENLPGKRRLSQMQGNDGKLVLRGAMSRFIPKEILERTKQGFSAPDASWFRGESIDYISRTLRDPKARIYWFLQPEYVKRILDEHMSGRINRRLLIWSFLSFEWWCRCFLERSAISFDDRGGIA